MARSGPARTVGDVRSGGARETREALVAAAIDALREKGYAGASAREIARRAGYNQALVFYHFGSVTNLLLEALDAVSAARRERYQTAVDGARGVDGLVDTAAAIFEEDLDAGYITVLVEMIAGASSTPGLGAEVASRIAPWREFAADAVQGALAGTPFTQIAEPTEIAHAIVALYLGLELLAQLDGDRRPALSLFERARQLGALVQLLGGTPAAEKGES
jgi:AcrR family transcriptional regulator